MELPADGDVCLMENRINASFQYECDALSDSIGHILISSKKGVLFSSTHFTAYR
jgi:hypothetical protein